MRSGSISLILPVYNEAKNIEIVIRNFYEEIKDRIDFEIVIAEDGSTDGTKEILQRLSKDIPMTIMMERKRLGYSGGLIRGLQKATGDYVLFCDSDGQHFPADLWKLYDEIENYDMVDGWRIIRADSVFRKVMSGTFQYFAKLLFNIRGLSDITAPYRLVKRSLALNIADQVKYMKESFWTEFTIRAAVCGAKIKEVPVRHKLRISGETVVYKPRKIPNIVYNQLRGMLKLRWELSIQSHPAVFLIY